MGQENTHKVIVLLLILAIVFSTLSVIIGLWALKTDLPFKRGVSDSSDASAGTLGFVVEASRSSSVGDGG